MSKEIGGKCCGGSTTCCKVGKVVGVRPTMSQVLVERLSAQEATNSLLIVGDKSDYGCPQGYVVAVGPGVKPAEVGINVGDRVLIQGTYTPVPNYDGNQRERGLLELHNIKGVLEEMHE